MTTVYSVREDRLHTRARYKVQLLTFRDSSRRRIIAVQTIDSFSNRSQANELRDQLNKQ